MKTLAIVFCYERPNVLRHCIAPLLPWAGREQASELWFIDDSPNDELAGLIIDETIDTDNAFYMSKPGNHGFGDSTKRALGLARDASPSFLYLIEGDYIMAPDGLDRIADCFENTPHGQHCLGIVGYDHPNFYKPEAIHHVFPACMKAQVGEDNCNRAVMYRPFRVQGKRHSLILERVSNTCFSCYLNWKKLTEIAAEFPELNDLLDQACEPRDNPNYPPSGDYKRRKIPDDGMLSHAINLVWNRWAIKHGIDRNEYSAWLNIKPSVAQHVSGGGMHAGACPELSTEAGSPSWGMKEYAL